MRLRRPAALMGTSILAASLATMGLASSAHADSPYEPNDSFNTAYGPIAAGTNYAASLETSNDEDYFSFYLTQRTQVSYTLAMAANPSGGDVCGELYQQTPDGPEEIDYSVTDPAAGSSDSASVTLARGKYYLEISCASSYGAKSYDFTFSPAGGFATLAQYAAPCLAAQATLKHQSAVVKAKRAKWRKAKAHHHARKAAKLKAGVRQAKAQWTADAAAEQAACAAV